MTEDSDPIEISRGLLMPANNPLSQSTIRSRNDIVVVIGTFMQNRYRKCHPAPVS